MNLKQFDCLDPQVDLTFLDTIALKKSNSTQLDELECTHPSPKLQCLYDKNCTELFKAIERGEWVGIMEFLDTGDWPGISLVPDFSPQEQAMTVVVRADASGDVHWSRLPLHQALLARAPMGAIRRLVEIYPQGVFWTDHVGNLALHIALIANVPEKIVVYLLAQCPQAVNRKNRNGLTPIDCAERATSEGSKARGKMLKIFSHFTTTTKMQVAQKSSQLVCDYDANCSKLYKKVQSKDWEAVKQFLDKGEWPAESFLSFMTMGIFSEEGKGNPEVEAQTLVTRHYTKDNEDVSWSRLPLHLAILCDAPLAVVSRLIDLYPASVYYPDSQSMLPLHLALYYNASDDVIAHLLMRYPDAVNKLGMDGLTPIECALQGQNFSRGQMLEMFLKEAAKASKSRCGLKLVSSRSMNSAKSSSGISVASASASSLSMSKSRD